MRLVFSLLISICVLSGADVFAQYKPRLVQLSGLVVEGDSMLAIPGVHVFIPKSGRGVSTNYIGYFSIPVQPGDSIIFAAIGYKKHSYILPTDSTGYMSVVIEMVSDTTMLPLVEIRRFPPEAVFKRAFLAMNVSNPKDDNARKNLNEQILRRLLADSEMTASINHSYFLNTQIQAIEHKYMQATIPFLNPFAWSRFFKDVESSKKRKEAEKAKKKSDEGY